ncbi:MAG TPA: DMT family transporter [Bacteroidales bacterium]|nr:DMT family transporter [Bacteroidales bacterium]
MQLPFLGEAVALSVSVCWAASSSSFEIASRKVGSLEVNIIRLMIAFGMLGIYGLIVHGSFFPTGGGPQQWLWLSVSGLIGFFIGDLMLFKSLTVIGARLSMLVMTFSPALTAIIGFALLGEKLKLTHVMGIMLIISGILMAFLSHNREAAGKKVSIKGLLLAMGGALGQACGLVFSKKGIGDYDPFAATQIRIITGAVFFALLITVLKRWPSLIRAAKDGSTMKFVTVGSFFGPGLGVGLSMMAITMTETGIASALMSLTPIVLIVPALIKGRKLALLEIMGAFVSVGGVLMLFLL